MISQRMVVQDGLEIDILAKDVVSKKRKSLTC